jgi:hypothetical protein
MKTEIKAEVLNYLKKSSKHLFEINGIEHKILILNDDTFIRITGNDISVYNIDNFINYYGTNTKCVIKHSLFLTPRYYNKEIKTIPYYKNARKKYESIINSIKDKTDKAEIITIIKTML